MNNEAPAALIDQPHSPMEDSTQISVNGVTLSSTDEEGIKRGTKLHAATTGEFVDALRWLSRGHIMVSLDTGLGMTLLDGARLYTAGPVLIQYGIVAKFDNPQGFPGAEYYKISQPGRHFANRTLKAWDKAPLLRRIWLRFAH